jgi:nucleotide-binding universal stress UspA family protein
LLVPLDGSKLAEAVLPAVRELARRFGARVTLLHVLERAAPKTVHGESHLADAAQAEAYLAGVARDLGAEAIRVDTHVHPNVERDVVRSLVEHAVELGSDLIVLATHGNGGLRDIVVGSIAEQVLGRGRTPILLIRPEFVSGSEPFQVRRLLVPLDGTPDSERALPLAEGMARAFQADTVLLRVVPTRGSLPGDQAAVAVMLPSATAAALEMEQAAAGDYLRRLSQSLADEGLAASEEVMRGDPTAVVLDEARRLGVDLVAMATHGKSGLEAFWSGSIGHRLSERLPVPLLILHSNRSG